MFSGEQEAWNLEERRSRRFDKRPKFPSGEPHENMSEEALRRRNKNIVDISIIYLIFISFPTCFIAAIIESTASPAASKV